MFRRYSVNFAVLSMLLDMCLTLVALIIAVSIRPSLSGLPFLIVAKAFELHVPFIIYIIVPILWISTFLLTSVYDPNHIRQLMDEFQRVFIATGLATLIFSGLLYLGFRDFSRWLLTIFIMLDLCLLLGWRIIARLIQNIGGLPSNNRHILIVGANAVGKRIAQTIHEHEWQGLNLIGYLDDCDDKINGEIPVLGKVRNARKIVEQNQIDDVVIALSQRDFGQINELVSDLHNVPVQVRIVPDYFSLALYRASAQDFAGIPMINLRDPALNDVQRLVKRFFDLLFSSITMVFLIPFISLAVIIIKLDSPGPAIFRQERVGENGRLFGMFKFRTMIIGAEGWEGTIGEKNIKDGINYKKDPNDPRITRVGRSLRRTSLDELPQLFNVIKGEMSLVGPRPELLWLVGQYELWQHKRFSVPQGMTGWWQINGRSEKSILMKSKDDIFYIQNYSLWMDIYILLKTPWVVMRGKGAY